MKRKQLTISANRYAAKLLFQFKVVINGNPGKRRICEERIAIFQGKTAKQALSQAKQYGKNCEHWYVNPDGHRVYFQFIGVMDLLRLGMGFDENEVWYEVKERLLPSERKSRLIPPASCLNAIVLEAEAKQ